MGLLDRRSFIVLGGVLRRSWSHTPKGKKRQQSKGRSDSSPSWTGGGLRQQWSRSRVLTNDLRNLINFFDSFLFLFLFQRHHRISSLVIMLAAVQNGDAKKVAELMRQDPGFNVNMAVDAYRCSTLHYACQGDQRSAVLPLLLAHPDIDVNVKTTYGYTPFSYACDGHTSCVRLLLKDSRVEVNEPERWMASGREMDLGEPGDIYVTDAIRKAKQRGYAEVVSLLERFKSDAAKTRSEVRKELGINGQYSDYYSIVFLFLFSFSVHKLLHF